MDESKRRGGRVKAVWNAAVVRVGRVLEHHYDGNTCTGFTQYVHMMLTLEREPDRMLSVRLTPAEARKWADALNEYADKAESENA